MRAGEINCRVTIQHNSGGVDDYGAPKEVWDEFATVWAAINLSGETGKIRIRYLPGVDAFMRVLCRSRVYKLKASPINPGERNEELILLVEEVLT